MTSAPIRRAMVLAAGRGERMRPSTETLPKPLLPVAGRPILHWVVRYLAAYGVRMVVINVAHLGEQIIDAIGDSLDLPDSDRDDRLRIVYSREVEPLGAGGGLKQAESLLRGADEAEPGEVDDDAFVVLNGVVLMDADLSAVIEAHSAATADVTLVVREDAEVERYGAVVVDADNRIRDIAGYVGAEPHAGDRRYMFTGLQILSPRVFEFLPGPRMLGDARVYPRSSTTADAFPAMIRAGLNLRVFVHTGLWGKIETPASYAALRALVERYGIERFSHAASAPPQEHGSER